MVVDKLKDKIVEIYRISERTIYMKIIIIQNFINVINAYTPQVKLKDNFKKR